MNNDCQSKLRTSTTSRLHIRRLPHLGDALQKVAYIAAGQPDHIRQDIAATSKSLPMDNVKFPFLASNWATARYGTILAC